MVADQRYDAILKHLQEAGSLTIRDFSALLGVTRETIRRDLTHLAGQGALQQVRGGAMALAQQEPDIGDRSALNAKGKKLIANYAKTLVEDGMSVLLDSGSTTLAIAHALTDHKRLTIITNDFSIAKVMQGAGHKVIVLGGEMSASDFGTCSLETIEAVQRYQMTLAFVGVGGLSEKALITDYSQQAAQLRTAMIRQASHAYFVADHQKFGQIKPVRVQDLHHASGILLDQAPGEAIKAQLEQIPIELMIA